MCYARKDHCFNYSIIVISSSSVLLAVQHHLRLDLQLLGREKHLCEGYSVICNVKC